MPTVAGIMCTWEEESMVPTAIDSVKNHIDELIVVNKPGQDNTEETIRDKCASVGLKLILVNNPMKLRFARLHAFTLTDCDWCLIVDGDEVYHTDGEAGLHRLEELTSVEACYRAPMNYLYLDFFHTRNTQTQHASHKFLYPNNEKIVLMKNKRDLPNYRGEIINLNEVYKFNCGIKPSKRLFYRRRYWWEWSKRYDGELGFYEWVEKHKINAEKLLPKNPFKQKDVIPYDEKRWGVRPKVIRDLIEKGKMKP